MQTAKQVHECAHADPCELLPCCLQMLAHGLHPDPLTATTMTMGTISLAAMWCCYHDSGHWTWNECLVLLSVLQTQVSEALDQKESATWGGGRIVLPFHCGRRHANHCMSDWNCLFRHTWWCWYLGTDIVGLMHPRNVRPGMKTEAAWLREPINDWSCATFTRIKPVMWVSLSVRWLRSIIDTIKIIFMVSIWIPRKVSWWLGLSVLCDAMGTPSSLYAEGVCCSATEHSSMHGGPKRRKLSW